MSKMSEEYNRRLEKYAPDLLRACKDIHERFIPQTPDDTKALVNLLRVIAKIEMLDKK